MPLNIAFISAHGGKPAAVVTHEESSDAVQADLDSAGGDNEKVVSFIQVEGVTADLLSALMGTDLMTDLEAFLTQVHNA